MVYACMSLRPLLAKLPAHEEELHFNAEVQATEYQLCCYDITGILSLDTTGGLPFPRPSSCAPPLSKMLVIPQQAYGAHETVLSP